MSVALTSMIWHLSVCHSSILAFCNVTVSLSKYPLSKRSETSISLERLESRVLDIVRPSSNAGQPPLPSVYELTNVLPGITADDTCLAAQWTAVRS